MAKLLLVDDETEACKAFEAAFPPPAGYSLRTCLDGTTAIDLYRRERSDLVFCDLKLPGLNGLSVLEAVKGIDPWATVILMSAYGTVEVATHAMRLGAYDFLEKPFSIMQLQELTHRALDHRRQLRQITLLQGKPGQAMDLPASLAQLEQLRADFLDLAIQELRAPLKILSEDLTLALQGFYGPWSDTQKQFLNRCSKVQALLSRLLSGSFAIFKSHEQRVNATSVDVRLLIQETLKETQITSQERSITLQVDLPREPLVGLTDADKVASIAGELLDNAVHFTPLGGRVEVELSPYDPRGFRLQVTDTGRGIAQEDREWLFTTFRRPLPGSLDPWKKTCLGLALVRHYLNLLNGTATVDSEPSQGSRFIVTIPWWHPLA